MSRRQGVLAGCPDTDCRQCKLDSVERREGERVPIPEHLLTRTGTVAYWGRDKWSHKALPISFSKRKYAYVPTYLQSWPCCMQQLRSVKSPRTPNEQIRSHSSRGTHRTRFLQASGHIFWQADQIHNLVLCDSVQRHLILYTLLIY